MKIARILIRGLVLGTCIGLILGYSSCGTKEMLSANKEERQKIIVGTDNYPPFNYEDVDGQPTGIDADLATEAFERMGYDVVFTYIDWEEKRELLEQGKIDCIWCCFSVTGREDLYRWSIPYMLSRQVVAVSKESDIYTLEDLKGKRIAVQSTTKPEEIFASHLDERIPELAEVFSLQNRELIYPFLSKGYADAVAAHETAILQCMKDYDLEYRILEEPLLSVGIGVAFSRDDERGMEQELSQIFKEMREDGTMEAIIGKYLEHPEEYLEVDGYEE